MSEPWELQHLDFEEVKKTQQKETKNKWYISKRIESRNLKQILVHQCS